MRHRFAAGEGTQHTARHASLVWRAPEGPKGLAVVPVGGGRAWPDNESTRRAKLAARAAGPDGARNTSGATSNNEQRGQLAGGPPPTAQPGHAPGPDGGRAAAHGRTKQPGPRMRKTPPRGCGTGIRYPVGYEV